MGELSMLLILTSSRLDLLVTNELTLLDKKDSRLVSSSSSVSLMIAETVKQTGLSV